MTLIRPGLMRNNRPRGNGVALRGLATLFDAPLTTSIVPMRAGGSSTPTYSRASTAYVQDYEGVFRQAISGEARFWGARRVMNQIGDSENFLSANWSITSFMSSRTGGQLDSRGGTAAAVVVPDGTNNPHFFNAVDVRTNPVVGDVAVIAVDVKAFDTLEFIQLCCSANWALGRPYVNFSLQLGTVTSTGGTGLLAYGIEPSGYGYWRIWMAVSVNTATVGSGLLLGFPATGTSARLANSTENRGLLLCFPQTEFQRGGSAVYTPSEYVSTNVLSTPFHGANVDGVKYLDTVRLHTQNLFLNSKFLAATSWSGTGSVGVCLPSGVEVVNGVSTGVIALRRVGAGYQGMQQALALLNLPTSGGVTLRLSVWVRRKTGVTLPSGNLAAYFAIGASVLALNATLAAQPVDTWVKYSTTYTTVPGDTLLSFISTAGNIGEGFDLAMPQATYTTQSVVQDTYLETDTTPLSVDTGNTAPIPSTTTQGFAREAAETNICLRSQEFDNATWSKDADLSVIADDALAPDNTLTADRITEGSAGTARIRQFTMTLVGGTRIACSIYAKRSAVVRWLKVGLSDDAADATGFNGWIDIQNGVIGSAVAFGTGTAIQIAIEPGPSGWWRINVCGTIDAASTLARMTIHSAAADAVSTRVAGSVYWLWGAQVCTLANIRGTGTYIPTTTAALTRSTDVHSYPSAGNMLMDRGGMYAEIKVCPRTPPNSILIGLSGGGPAYPFFYGGANAFSGYDGTFFPTVSGTMQDYTQFKCALIWGASTFRSAMTGRVPNQLAFNNTFNGPHTALPVGGGNTTMFIKNLRVYGEKPTSAQQDAMVA